MIIIHMIAYQCDPPQSLFLKISLPFLPKSAIIVLVLLGKKFSAYLDGALIILIMIIIGKKTIFIIILPVFIVFIYYW